MYTYHRNMTYAAPSTVTHDRHHQSQVQAGMQPVSRLVIMRINVR